MTDSPHPFYLYLVTHPHLMLHKIGIGTKGKDKGHLESLVGQGWEILGLWSDKNKHKPFQWEKLIFERLEAKAAEMDLVKPGLVGKRDKHWVEIITTELISGPDVTQLIQSVVSKKSFEKSC